MDKSPAALIIELGKKKSEAPEEETSDDFATVAEELIALAKDEDAEGFAAALKDFVYMCMENKE